MTEKHHALYFVHAITPLRVGADQGIGAIDLPTLREAHTGWPILPGSSIKGVLREQAEEHFRSKSGSDNRASPNGSNDDVEAIFGPPTERAGDFRGGMIFGDAYPLLLPVQSLAGTFAWATCPQVLRRLARDAKEAGIGEKLDPPMPLTADKVIVAERSALIVQGAPPQSGNSILLGELCLGVDVKKEEPSKLEALANQLAEWIFENFEGNDKEFFLDRFAIVPDNLFSYFCRHKMEIRARVSIDPESGTVNVGPWTEEMIPAETVLCGILQARGTKLHRRSPRDGDAGRNVETEPGERRGPNQVLEDLRKVLAHSQVLRVGGHASVGLGRARITLTPPDRGEPKKGGRQ